MEAVGAGANPDALDRVAITPRTSVVVATHGEEDEDMLERVLAKGAGYVSLVASRKRAAAVVESLRQRGVPVERLGRLKAPAGLDIGAVTPTEIAVSILAEIIQLHRSEKWPVIDSSLPPSATLRLTTARPTMEASASDAGVSAAPSSPEAVDPVCGMAVKVATARYRPRWMGARCTSVAAVARRSSTRPPIGILPGDTALRFRPGTRRRHLLEAGPAEAAPAVRTHYPCSATWSRRPAPRTLSTSAS